MNSLLEKLSGLGALVSPSSVNNLTGNSNGSKKDRSGSKVPISLRRKRNRIKNRLARISRKKNR